MIASSSYSLVYTNHQRILNLASLLSTSPSPSSSSVVASKYVFLIWKACPIDNQSDTYKQVKQAIHSLTSQYLIRSIQHTSKQDHSLWFAAANEAINVLYQLSPRFDKVAESVLKKAGSALFLKQMTGNRNESVFEEVNENQNTVVSSSDNPQSEADHDETINRVSEVSLSRFLFLLGQIALKLLQYCEQLTSRAKKSRMRHEEQEQQLRKQTRRKRVNRSTFGGTDRDDDDANMGVVTQAADIEEDIIEEISTHGIVVE